MFPFYQRSNYSEGKEFQPMKSGLFMTYRLQIHWTNSCYKKQSDPDQAKAKSETSRCTYCCHSHWVPAPLGFRRQTPGKNWRIELPDFRFLSKSFCGCQFDKGQFCEVWINVACLVQGQAEGFRAINRSVWLAGRGSKSTSSPLKSEKWVPEKRLLNGWWPARVREIYTLA